MKRTAAAERPSASTQRLLLDNGLVVLVRPRAGARSVALHLSLRAGSAFDPPLQAGTANLVARLLDRGAGALSARTIAQDFDALGISFLARARLDSLDLTLRLLPGHLPFALERLRLLVSEPTFPQEECDGERARVLTEIAERDQDTAARCEELLAGALFPDTHPYHAPSIGTRASIGSSTRTDLASFHAARCRPHGAVLAIAGDAFDEGVLRDVTRLFGSWRVPEATAPDPRSEPFPEAPAPEGARVLIEPIAGKTQADVGLGFVPAIHRRGPDLQAVLVMNSVLGDFGMGGRLGEQIRERAGLAYYAHSYVWSGLSPGPVVARAGVAPQGVRRAVDLMFSTIETFLRRGPLPRELSDSRQALASALPRRFETHAGAAALLADCEFQGLGHDYPDRLPGLIGAVKLEDVNEAARRYLTPGRHILVVTGPAKKLEFKPAGGRRSRRRPRRGR